MRQRRKETAAESLAGRSQEFGNEGRLYEL
jgi:hypothetical protein